MIGRYNSGVVIEKNDGDTSSRRRWKQVAAISNQFSKRWLIEYLPTLQSRRKWNVNQTNIESGTIVLLKEQNLRRGNWSLAQMIDVCPSSDGIGDCTSSNSEDYDRRIRSTSREDLPSGM